MTSVTSSTSGASVVQLDTPPPDAPELAQPPPSSTQEPPNRVADEDSNLWASSARDLLVVGASAGGTVAGEVACAAFPLTAPISPLCGVLAGTAAGTATGAVWDSVQTGSFNTEHAKDDAITSFAVSLLTALGGAGAKKFDF